MGHRRYNSLSSDGLPSVRSLVSCCQWCYRYMSTGVCECHGNAAVFLINHVVCGELELRSRSMSQSNWVRSLLVWLESWSQSDQLELRVWLSVLSYFNRVCPYYFFNSFSRLRSRPYFCIFSVISIKHTTLCYSLIKRISSIHSFRIRPQLVM